MFCCTSLKDQYHGRILRPTTRRRSMRRLWRRNYPYRLIDCVSPCLMNSETYSCIAEIYNSKNSQITPTSKTCLKTQWKEKAFNSTTTIAGTIGSTDESYIFLLKIYFIMRSYLFDELVLAKAHDVGLGVYPNHHHLSAHSCLFLAARRKFVG